MSTVPKSWPRKKKTVFRTARRLAIGGTPTSALKLIDTYLQQEEKNDVDLLLLKSNILEMTGKSTPAAKIARHILRLAPADPLALMDLGDYYRALRKPNYRKALQSYEKAFRLVDEGQFHYDEEDEFIDACEGKADILLALQRPMVALRCVVAGLQKHPTSLTLGKVLQKAQEQYAALQEKKAHVRRRR
jgi:tetratricopeptide (TPR) repeat protein